MRYIRFDGMVDQQARVAMQRRPIAIVVVGVGGVDVRTHPKRVEHPRLVLVRGQRAHLSEHSQDEARACDGRSAIMGMGELGC